MSVEVTTQHKGFFVFKVCQSLQWEDDPEQDCFDRFTKTHITIFLSFILDMKNLILAMENLRFQLVAPTTRCSLGIRVPTTFKWSSRKTFSATIASFRFFKIPNMAEDFTKCNWISYFDKSSGPGPQATIGASAKTVALTKVVESKKHSGHAQTSKLNNSILNRINTHSKLLLVWILDLLESLQGLSCKYLVLRMLSVSRLYFLKKLSFADILTRNPTRQFKYKNTSRRL